MKMIGKFPLLATRPVVIEMPFGAEVLSVQTQNEEAMVWAKIDTASPTIMRHFHVRATGEEFTGEEGRFIGTFQMHGGSLVWHLFEAA